MAKGLWIVLNVDNVDKSVEWYKALGLKVRSETMEMPGVGNATMGTLEIGESGLIFWNKHLVPPDQSADTKAWVSGDLGKGVLISLGVPDARKTWANAQKIRAEVEQAIEEQPFGGRSFTLVDPDGYVLSVADKWPGETASKPRKAAKKAKAAKGRAASRKPAKKTATKRHR